MILCKSKLLNVLYTKCTKLMQNGEVLSVRPYVLSPILPNAFGLNLVLVFSKNLSGTFVSNLQ